MNLWLALLALLAGAGTAVQTGMNAQLRISLGHSLLAALVNFSVGLICLTGLLVVLRVPFPAKAELLSIPRWSLLGGVCGAFFIATLAYTGRDLGAVLLVALLLVGQMLASVLFDHYGLLGFPQRGFSVSRFFGCLLLLGGAILIRRG